MYYLLLFIPVAFIAFLVFGNVPFVKRILSYSRLDNSFLMRFGREDDSDMKIADYNYYNQNKAVQNAENIFEISKMQKHKENGNLDKAKKLGEELSVISAAHDGVAVFGIDESEGSEARLQRRILLAFCVSYCLETWINDEIVSKTTENNYYNSLRQKDFKLYRKLGETGAFSIYYLSARSGEEIESHIGRDFAMLSAREDDKPTAELGTALFDYFCLYVKSIIDKADFIL